MLNQLMRETQYLPIRGIAQKILFGERLTILKALSGSNQEKYMIDNNQLLDNDYEFQHQLDQEQEMWDELQDADYVAKEKSKNESN